MGERLEWYRVASHLGMLVSELKGKVTYTEFLEWCFFLQKEEARNTKSDYYLAQIAATITRANVKNPKSVKVENFLIEMKARPKTTPQQSKSIWAAHLGIDLTKKGKK